MSPQARKAVGAWLFIGCVMVFFQVVLGGITRLTESGLSITEWKPLNGTIPPLNDTQWNEEFELYKQKVQYQVINEGMTLAEFKWIFFWEYFHRLWARLMGVVFAIGFVYFLLKKYFDRELVWPLVGLFFLGGIQGFVGWIMVRGGLDSMFVPPLRLTTHLILAFILLCYLIWITLRVYRGNSEFQVSSLKLGALKAFSVALVALVFLQLFFGGLLSGMKAGLAYPTWPDMNGQFVPSALFSEQPTFAGFVKYVPQDYWGRTLIQFVHRITAYTLIVVIAVFWWKSRGITKDSFFQKGLTALPVLVLVQAVLGIITVLNCVGHIPVGLGVLHQAGGMLLLANTVFITFHLYNAELKSE